MPQQTGLSNIGGPEVASSSDTTKGGAIDVHVWAEFTDKTILAGVQVLASITSNSSQPKFDSDNWIVFLFCFLLYTQ